MLKCHKISYFLYQQSARLENKNRFIPQDQGNEMYSTQSFNECAFVHFNGN